MGRWHMRTRHRAGWVVVGVIGAAGCSGHGAEGTSGAASGSTPLACPPPEPTYHRASADACPVNTTTETCSADTDCTASTPGKCAGGFCNYDACTTDADCGASGMVCSCAGQSYSTGFYTYVIPSSNACVGGNCRVDADCGSGFFCSPDFTAGCPPVLDGFYCHTCEDGCIEDGDCPTGVDDGVFLCTFEASHGARVCQLGGCSGT